MKLLYAGHRYHTNQVPIMKGWQQRGDEVHFFAQYEGVTEVHDYVHFHLMKPTRGTLRRFEELDRTLPEDKAESAKIRAFMPDFWDLYRSIRAIMPDVVILREYAKPNAVIVLVCRLLGIRNIVMYTQVPLYGEPEQLSSGQKIFRRLCFPKTCFTPVYCRGEIREKTELKTNPGAPGYFVPLICEETKESDRVYCRDGKVHILDVGKYRDYKNHFFFVDAVAAMEHRDNLEVTIVGQLSNAAERDYYEKLKAYVEEKGLSGVITLRGNVPFYEMENLYRQQDILALASTLETAGMVILESMAMGLCVVSSIHCGLAGYLEEYGCGYTFALDRPERMSVILDDLMLHPEKIREAGASARKAVKEHFSFSNYVESLNELTREAYGFEIPQS